MKSFLQPMVSIMNRLKYVQKFTLIFCLFFVPIAGSLALIVYTIGNEIRFATQERIGLKSVLELQSIIQNVQQHRGLSAGYLGGNHSLQGKMKEEQAQIQNHISNFNQYLQEEGSLINPNGKWESITNDWNDITQNVEKWDTSTSFQRHTLLVQEILLFSSSIGDSTNLFLDSNVIHNHLVRVIANDLIYTTEYMGQARAIGTSVLASHQLSNEKHFDLLYLSRLMDEKLIEAEKNMNIVLQDQKGAGSNITSLYQDAMTSSKSMAQLIKQEILEKQQLNYDSASYYDEATESIDKVYALIEDNAKLLDQLLVKHLDVLHFRQNMVLGTNILAMILAIFLFIAFYRSVRESIEIIDLTTAEISKGDLTQRIQLKTKDETHKIQDSINTMMDSIQNLIRANQNLSEELSASAEELSASAQECSMASEQIAVVSQTVASGSEHQMKSVEDATHSINQMSAHIQEVASNSEEMMQLFLSTTESTKQGAVLVKDVLCGMDEIHSNVQESAATIRRLGDSSKKIGDIVGMITEIANQTNLLALNAAIEAARAGEQGRGFAVVANEVRKLAEQSNKSAEQISSLIAGIQQETLGAVQSMELGTKKVTDGLLRTEEVNKVFQEINESVLNVTHKVRNVSHAVENIASESSHITHAMEIIKEAAAEDAQASQECSAASEEQLAAMEEISASSTALSNMAEELQALIKQFKV